MDDGREGLRIARLFRKYRVGLDVRRCDLEALCEEDFIECFDSDLMEPGYTALIQRCPDGLGGGIIALQPGQDGGRRRFSIAHELGHYHIPKHRGLEGYCADRDMRARPADANQREWEANDFATELLMPRKLFAEDARKLDVSIESAVKLGAADWYDVSIMAAAWRIVQLTREPAAVVVSADGKVEWMYRSDAFRLPLTERGQYLHADTLAAAAFRDQTAMPRVQEVDRTAWLDGRVEVPGTLLESTHLIRSLGQVVSLLWLTETEGELGDGRD